MVTKKIILLLFLAFYFSCGFYQANVFEQLNNNHNIDGDTIITSNKNKYGHGAESHVVGARGSGGEVNGDGYRSPGSSNFIPIYAANAHNNHHRGGASNHKSHNVYLALFTIMFFVYLCI
uniref:Glycine-rich protein n=1 Tax=Solanum lycopersicum TaxID=4081 RepID=A0A3Q7IQP1_SOLLC